jgi:hypothetical protein
MPAAIYKNRGYVPALIVGVAHDLAHVSSAFECLVHNGMSRFLIASSVFSLPKVRLPLNGFDTASLIERCSYLQWIEKGQPPDLVEGDQAVCLPFTERPH